MSVPFVDMKRLHGALRGELMDAFARVVDSGGYVQGNEVARLEREFAGGYGARRALAVSNGTAALHLALRACDIGPGDEVVTVSNTFIATAEAISVCGATPVFADIDADGFNIDPKDIEHRITVRTKAIIAVHLYGRMAPMAALREVADRHGLRLIEDACQAHGAMMDGAKAGAIGDVGCLSFYPTKNLGTVGEGGMVLTQDPELSTRMAQLRDHGQAGRHHHVEPGFNYRMPELQAAALRTFLPYLSRWNAGRIRAARTYDRLLERSDVVRPHPGEPGSHVYHLYVVRSAEREALKLHLKARGVSTAVHYPTPVHLQPAYINSDGGPGSLPRTEEAVSEVLSLPMHPLLSESEVREVCGAIRSFRAPTRSPQPALTGVAR
jgi:dTDP-4-amino-4,6-dideoxygalactose transaminase